MNNDTEAEYEGAIESLVIARATQAGEANNARFSEGVLQHLADQDQMTIRLFLGCIGHLVHYGTGAEIEGLEEWLRALFEQLITALGCAKDRGTGELLPGDLVEIVAGRPQDHLKAGMIMRVYCVGDDGTVDVGYETVWSNLNPSPPSVDPHHPRGGWVSICFPFGRLLNRFVPERVSGPAAGTFRPAYVSVACPAVPHGRRHPAAALVRLDFPLAATDQDIQPAEGRHRHDEAKPGEPLLSDGRFLRRGIGVGFPANCASGNKCQRESHGQWGDDPGPHSAPPSSTTGRTGGASGRMGEVGGLQPECRGGCPNVK
jgi:hypothetical protein